MTDCVEKLRNSLFMVGEIGGNDYNYALLQGKSIEQVTSMVSEVVQEITNSIKVFFFMSCFLISIAIIHSFFMFNLSKCLSF